MHAPNRKTRDLCLKQMTQTLDALHGESNDVEASRALQKTYDSLLHRYIDTLPHVTIARCPFTNELVEAPLDLFGLDGLWWDINGPTSMAAISGAAISGAAISGAAISGAPISGAHHVVTLGAFDLCGHEPTEANTPLIQSIELGPEIPYIIPRLMKFQSMRCVMHSLPVCDGRYQATLMSYFSDPPLDTTQGHQPWLRANFAYKHDEQVLWKRVDDVIDFELEPWIEQTPPRVFWIDPNDTSMTLRSGVSECPFINLKGTRDIQIVRSGKVSTLNL